MTRLLINIEHIKPDGLGIACSEQTDNFPVLAELSASGQIEFTGPLEVDLQIKRIAELVNVSGRFNVPVRLVCSRCLTAFESALSQQFEIVCIQQPAEADNLEDEKEIELNREDLNVFVFQGEEIDLRPALEEQVVMAIPMKSLCRKTCRGICSQCGSDLNQRDCGCRKGPRDNRFAVLKDFKV